MFVFIGIIIFVVSFVIALLSLVREQRGAKEEKETADVLEEPTSNMAVNGQTAASQPQTSTQTQPQDQIQVKTPPVSDEVPVRDFPWEKNNAAVDELSKKVDDLASKQIKQVVDSLANGPAKSEPDQASEKPVKVARDAEPFSADSIAAGGTVTIDLSKLSRKP